MEGFVDLGGSVVRVQDSEIHTVALMAAHLLSTGMGRELAVSTAIILYYDIKAQMGTNAHVGRRVKP